MVTNSAAGGIRIPMSSSYKLRISLTVRNSRVFFVDGGYINRKLPTPICIESQPEPTAKEATKTTNPTILKEIELARKTQ
jgi:hypothetical protein